MIKIKRIYELPTRADGLRILVDRLWPRGIRKDKARVDIWLRDFAPSSQLRKWFAHDLSKWESFKRKYFKELNENKDLIALITKSPKGTITFLYSAKDEKYNNALALKEYIDSRL